MFCRSRVAALAILVTLLSVSSEAFAQDSEVTDRVTVTAAKLRTFCQACHGIGELRFFRGETDAEMFRFIVSEKAPRSGKLWIDSIIEVLSWPGSRMPAFDEFMIPPDRDWMPKGARRIDLARDSVDGIPTREVILETLRSLDRVHVDGTPEDAHIRPE